MEPGIFSDTRCMFAMGMAAAEKLHKLVTICQIYSK